MISKRNKKLIEVAPGTKLGIVKMKRIPYLLLAMLPLLIFSCNGKEKTLKPMSSKIEGPIAECFEVVVRDYKIIGNQVNIEFLRIKDGAVEPQIVAEFLDDNGNVIATSIIDGNKDDFRFLLANKVGESSTLAFAIDNSNPTQVRFNSSESNMENDEVSEMALEEEETVILDEVVEEVSEAPVTLEEETEVETKKEEVVVVEVQKEEQESSQSVKSINSRDWDKVLDDFESYVDKYISFSKKASSGDLTALAEYASLLEKTEKLEKELNAAQNEMTKAQMKRYLQIIEKMTNAAIDMY